VGGSPHEAYQRSVAGASAFAIFSTDDLVPVLLDTCLIRLQNSDIASVP
jgi:hypothetical protein